MRLLAGLCLAAILVACGGGSVPFAVTRHNATDEVAKDFVISFDGGYTSRGRGDLAPGRSGREGLVGDRLPDAARAQWTSPDGATHCKEIRVADSAPEGFPGGKGFPTLVFRIVGRDEVTVLFQVPDNERAAEDANSEHKELAPRRPLQITACTEKSPG
jgi:hypothetical protein